jgi:hypothetical protein
MVTFTSNPKTSLWGSIFAILIAIGSTLVTLVPEDWKPWVDIIIKALTGISGVLMAKNSTDAG